MRMIIAYKIAKGCLMLLAGLVFTIALWRGQADHLHAFALSLREHVTARLAIEASEFLLRVATPGRLALTSIAIGADGAITFVEAWLLHRRTRLAIWLVVIASSSLIPWELYELVFHFRILRLVLLVFNVVVVIYLGLQASRHVAHRRALTVQRRAEATAPEAGPPA